MKETELQYGDLQRENRQLKKTVHALLDELEQAQGVDVDVQAVRETLPPTVDEGREGIDPPWEREGYESKSEWLADRAD